MTGGPALSAGDARAWARAVAERAEAGCRLGRARRQRGRVGAGLGRANWAAGKGWVLGWWAGFLDLGFPFYFYFYFSSISKSNSNKV
jgi:hypothetical protein